MSNEIKKEDLREGFRVGDYFVSFPPGDFVHENEKGEMYIDVDIFKLDKDRAYKVNNQLTPEIQHMINEEINKMLVAAINRIEKNDGDIDV